MFMVSVKVTRRKVCITALVLVLAVSAGVLWPKYRGEAVETAKPESSAAKPEPAGVPAMEQKSESTAKKTKINTKKAAGKTNDQRIEFIESFGWEVNAEASEVMEVIIPKEFDAVYKEYNSIQKTQGFDLSGYAGKRCKRYSYEVLNYPGEVGEVRVNLLIHSNKIIGGDICSLQEGGFMHGFEYVEKAD